MSHSLFTEEPHNSNHQQPQRRHDTTSQGGSSIVCSISELNERIRLLIEDKVGVIWVKGEVSGFTSAGSGHWYFQLKDKKAQVRVAMFKGANQAIKQVPKNGDELEVLVQVSLYVPRGDFQLIALDIRSVGQGGLYEQFLKNKQQLASEGWFEVERKKKIPFFVKKVGVITSLQAAALQDVLSTLTRRAPYVQIIVYPSSVQGAEALVGLVRAVETANQHRQCDVLLVVRGGGSMEDLWVFNEMDLIRAVGRGHIPVVSGVGHETDTCLIDFVADARAATPTAAAELVAKPIWDWLEMLSAQQKRIQRALQRQVRDLNIQLDHLDSRLMSPKDKWNLLLSQVRQLQLRLMVGGERKVLNLKSEYEKSVIRYKHVVSLDKNVQALASLEFLLKSRVKNLLVHFQARLEKCNIRMQLGGTQNTLNRGFLLATSMDGTLIKSVANISSGQKLILRLCDGELQVKVEEVHKKGDLLGS
jgi:exodeoxyribonuclease VII large subunit